ncbi:type 1 glutamine amidotransferase domain-containing protein [Microbacterium sp. 3J1]|uniref:type 1 glutamine amidotransferase domain-containing protein n=1 Tax=Microbacterium sp. 3J1 TaxID=861269 RepID=UPI000AE2B212|nr:type 1 glutamine amidotransferase domain-containing protein [Microbacterium sp. 3J1]
MPITHDHDVSDNRAGIGHGRTRGRVAILTADDVEDVEFFYPYYRFVEEGFDVDVLTPASTTVTGYKGLSLSTGVSAVADANPADYDLLFIPGGLAPGAVRQDSDSVSFVQDFATTGRVIGAVCHGPQVLVTAGLVEGRRMTSWKDVAHEIRDAGGEYVDEPVVEDAQFITARKPGDMPREMARIFERLTEANGENA